MDKDLIQDEAIRKTIKVGLVELIRVFQVCMKTYMKETGRSKPRKARRKKVTGQN